MIVTYLRSSSIGTFDACSHAYFMEYVLGIKRPANKAADKGSAVHKALEILTLSKDKKHKCEYGTFGPDSTVEEIATACYEGYKQPKWTGADYRDVIHWTQKAVEMEGGHFNPRTMPILEVEKFFDYTIEDEWGKFEFDFQGKKHKGQLALRGTVDVVLDHEDHYEIVDWKTGRRKNWTTGEVKDYHKLKNDNQLLLYYYVMTKLFNKPVSLTIVYINDGGSFTIPFDTEDAIKAENMIKDRFNQIRNMKVTKPIYPADFCVFCYYGKNSFSGSNLSQCREIEKEIYTIGMDKVLEKRVTNKGKHIFKYGEGGGRKAQ